MKILILSIPNDAHAIAVACALTQRGHGVSLYCAPAAIGGTDMSLKISNRGSNWSLDTTERDAAYYDMIWLRRRSSPLLTSQVHPDDTEFVLRENGAFFGNFWSLAADENVRWIHDSPASNNGENKIRQLAIARSCGLRVPDTLITGHIDTILRFINDSENDGAQVIYKTFSSVGWLEAGRTRIKHTTVIDEDTIRSHPAVTLTPGIYQRRLDKQFEVRANIFGDEDYSIKINACRTEAGSVDWRSSLDLTGQVEQFELPRSVARQCRSLLEKLNLTMACIDLVVDTAGEYHFIEINQQGQFLWVEECCPQIPMLDKFTRFLTRCELGSADSQREIRLADVMQSEMYIELMDRFCAGAMLELS
jgi:glutathione synthase/RimK-type ligase-like ATP-grasp enzyme